ncbi:MAG: glycosyltransferase [Thermoanaerobaculia bacterium]|nr:glycosyltransferase [Thermoanaerobaculia bacterium]
MFESRGTHSRVRNLVAALGRQSGVELLAVTGDGPEAGERLGVAHRGFASPEEGPAALAAAVAAFRPRVVHGHTHKALRLLSEIPAPAVRVADLHGDRAGEKLEQSWRPWSQRIRGYLRDRAEDRLLLPRLDAFTVVTEALARRVRRFGKPVAIVPGGVDPELFRPTPSPPAPELRIGYAGNFRPYQGIGQILDAAERLVRQGASVRFRLIGDLAAFPEIGERARRILGDNLETVPHIPYEEVPAMLAPMDVLLVPRPDNRTARHGFPSKLPEYLAMGKAVVATRVGDPGRMLRHGENGLLVAAGSGAELADALLLLRDPALRERLGRAARRDAVERFSWDRVAADLAGFLRGVARA